MAETLNLAQSVCRLFFLQRGGSLPHTPRSEKMTPNLRISKKVRDRVYRLWRRRPDLCFDEVAALLGYSPIELIRLTRRWVWATSKEFQRKLVKQEQKGGA